MEGYNDKLEKKIKKSMQKRQEIDGSKLYA